MLALCLPIAAQAGVDGRGDHGWRRHRVLEFDAEAAGAVAAIVAGGGVLLARRRRR